MIGAANGSTGPAVVPENCRLSSLDSEAIVSDGDLLPSEAPVCVAELLLECDALVSRRGRGVRDGDMAPIATGDAVLSIGDCECADCGCVDVDDCDPYR